MTINISKRSIYAVSCSLASSLLIDSFIIFTYSNHFLLYLQFYCLTLASLIT